jgi:hypothetical protein
MHQFFSAVTDPPPPLDYNFENGSTSDEVHALHLKIANNAGGTTTVTFPNDGKPSTAKKWNA